MDLHPKCSGPWDRGDTNYPIEEHIRDCDRCQKHNLKLRIMIMVPHYWGKADTISKAWANVKKESGDSLRELKRDRWRIYVVWDTYDVKTHINDMGSICYPSNYPYHMIDEH